jgi:hypothetical protein
VPLAEATRVRSPRSCLESGWKVARPAAARSRDLTTTVRGVQIWTEAWEWQCCGEPFAVGDEVEWGLRPLSAESRAFLAEPLGTQSAEQLTHGETHHEGADDEPTVPTRGRVESIQAVHWRVAPRSRSKPRVLYPVAGTGVVSRQTADGWEPEPEETVSFAGYIVELSPLGEAPPTAVG